MALAPGVRLGPNETTAEITAQIGVVGMGEVCRATDTKLKREVAIKVLGFGLAKALEPTGPYFKLASGGITDAREQQACAHATA